MNEVGLIRIPVHVLEKLESSADDLSAEIKAAASRARNIVSIDDLDEDDTTMSWDGAIEAGVLAADRRRIVGALLRSLPEREAVILKLRHGLGDASDEPQTLDIIGKKLGLTRERIRQLEGRAMGQLRVDPFARELYSLL
jgi:RNA polymerase sigma factor (sigma-70 family)